MAKKYKHSESVLKQQKQSRNLNSAKLQKDILLPEDGDDESGGGNGKRMQGSYKLEKLLGAIGKGRMKAQNFWRFLNKEGLDSHEVKKTTLGKQKETVTTVSEKLDKAQELQETQEKAQELQEKQKHQTSDDDAFLSDEELDGLSDSEASDEPAWEKAKATDENARQRFGFQDSPFDATSNAEASRRAVTGNRVQGSIVSGTTNPLGFIHQVDVTGDAGRANTGLASQTSLDIQGGRVQGSVHSKQFDHVGSQQFNHSGKNASQFLYSKGLVSSSGNSKAQSKQATVTTAQGDARNVKVRSR